VDSIGNNLSQSRFVININVGGSFAGGGGAGAFANGGIRSPDRDVVVQVGNSVSFDGDSLDPNQFVNANYLWQFNQISGSRGNRIRDINRPNAGQVTFDTDGEFDVRFNVDGVDRSPARRYRLARRAECWCCHLTAAAFHPAPACPHCEHASKRQIEPQAIRVGESIDFAGSVSGASPNAQLRFDWDFAGSAPIPARKYPDVSPLAASAISTFVCKYGIRMAALTPIRQAFEYASTHNR